MKITIPPKTELIIFRNKTAYEVKVYWSGVPFAVVSPKDLCMVSSIANFPGRQYKYFPMIELFITRRIGIEFK